MGKIDVLGSAGEAFTVVGYHANTDQVVSDSVRAVDAISAARIVQAEGGNEDLIVVEVFQGFLDSALTSDRLIMPEGYEPSSSC